MMNLPRTMEALVKAFGEPTLLTLTTIFDNQGPNVEKQLKRAQRIIERAAIWRKQVGELQRSLQASNQVISDLQRFNRYHVEHVQARGERIAQLEQAVRTSNEALANVCKEREQLRADLNAVLQQVGALRDLLEDKRSEREG